MSKTDLATQKTALAEQQDLDELAAFIKANANAGTALLPDTDIVFPRLLILQPMSPLVTQQDQRPGTIANSVTEDNYGTSFDFYLLHAYASRARWMTPEPGSDLDCTSADYVNGSVKDEDHGFGVCAKCPLNLWIDKKPPSCTESRNLIIMPAAGGDLPLILSTSRSGLKATAQFTSTLRGKPSYAALFRLTLEKQMRDSKVWYTPKFTKVQDIVDPTREGFVAADALKQLKLLKAMSDSVAAAQERIVLKPEQGDGAPTGVADDQEGSF